VSGGGVIVGGGGGTGAGGGGGGGGGTFASWLNILTHNRHTRRSSVGFTDSIVTGIGTHEDEAQRHQKLGCCPIAEISAKYFTFSNRL
jgi:hypothetical protein